MPDEFDYSFMSTTRDGEEYEAPWTQGPSVDGKEDFSFVWEGDMEGATRDISGADPDTHNEVASDDD